MATLIKEQALETFSFNQLLKQSGLDPKDVKLYRHTETHFEKSVTIYEAWLDLELRKEFEEHQACHSKNHLSKDYLASFIDTKHGAVFVGIYKVTDRQRNPENGLYYYGLEKQEYLAPFEGRLVIKWPRDRASSRLAETTNVEILEYHRSTLISEFPGFKNFTCSLDPKSLDLLPTNWKEVLKNSKGVYFLSFPQNGQYYVGSAYNPAGFYGRWQTYLKTDGTGHNKKLIDLSKQPDYCHPIVTVLEVASSVASENDIIEREQVWKTLLHSRNPYTGLNLN